ncbi:MAG: AbrB family transcriptional regulator [Mesorhizobium sp.]|nr:AbrB family transcriptional regulator [Mesorhizobium sp.]MCO5162852.1 AbrB family transcriptional regulator [Mesorhizobium sp.]
MRPEQADPTSPLPKPGWWALLAGLSIILSVLFEWVDLPAGLLIGPMIAGIVVGVLGARLSLPPLVSRAALAIIGCLIAASLEPALFAALAGDWPILLGATLATLVASGALGGLIARFGILPGTTAIWGSAPGAASAMVLMADAFGADARLVAFMQYVRVIMVSVAAALIARLFVDTSGIEAPDVVWFPALEWSAFSTTLLVAAVGLGGAWLARLPAMMFLGPLVVGIVAHAGFGLPLQLPHWLLAVSYVLVGWSIGLRFDRKVLAHAGRSLPQVMLAVLVLIGFCGGVAWVLTKLLGIDPLTAYLATSPGGMDSVAVIAAASGSVDMAFVMSMQMMRFLIVLLIGPPVARWFAERIRVPD